MATNDSIDTLLFEDSTVLVVYTEKDVKEVPDSVLIQEIERRGEDFDKFIHNKNYGQAVVSLFVIVFVVYAIIKKRRKNG